MFRQPYMSSNLKGHAFSHTHNYQSAKQLEHFPLQIFPANNQCDTLFEEHAPTP